MFLTFLLFLQNEAAKKKGTKTKEGRNYSIFYSRNFFFSKLDFRSVETDVVGEDFFFYVLL